MKFISVKQMLAIAIVFFVNTLVYAGDNNEYRKFIVSMKAAAGITVAESQLSASLNTASDSLEGTHQVTLLEEYRAPHTWFLAMQAKDRPALDAYLADVGVAADKIIESLFINSPAVGGGPVAGETPKDGHKVYLIQRSIPGIGLAPLEKKIAVSKGSQKIIKEMGGTVEWDHSFLTSEGTYCVYRGVDPAAIKEHATIAGIPADPITEVEHIVRNFQF